MDRFTDRLAGRLSGGMKQKLALACALVPEPQVLLLDEPTTGVDPVSRREFWDALAHLAADGLTILVATPYLDEAERCHRVALMHEGGIQRSGTPAELRAQARRHAARSARVTDLGDAEELLSAISGPTATIVDVQRFGDRLDVMVARTRAERSAIVARQLTAAGLEVEEIRADEPTLENTFVAMLRELGEEPRRPVSRPTRSRRTARPDVAIGAAPSDQDVRRLLAR